MMLECRLQDVLGFSVGGFRFNVPGLGFRLITGEALRFKCAGFKFKV